MSNSSGDSSAGGGSDFFNKLGEALGEVFERGRDELVRGAKVSRVVMDQRSLEADRDRLLIQIGKSAVAGVRAGRINDDALAGKIQRLDSLEARIKGLRSEKEMLKEGVAQEPQSVDTPAPAADEVVDVAPDTTDEAPNTAEEAPASEPVADAEEAPASEAEAPTDGA